MKHLILSFLLHYYVWKLYSFEVHRISSMECQRRKSLRLSLYIIWWVWAASCFISVDVVLRWKLTSENFILYIFIKVILNQSIIFLLLHFLQHQIEDIGEGCCVVFDGWLDLHFLLFRLTLDSLAWNYFFKVWLFVWQLDLLLYIVLCRLIECYVRDLSTKLHQFF